jgi:hypothetical protein
MPHQPQDSDLLDPLRDCVNPAVTRPTLQVTNYTDVLGCSIAKVMWSLSVEPGFKPRLIWVVHLCSGLGLKT